MPFILEVYKKELDALRGRNLYGEPNIRVVWGASERDHLDRPKYVSPNGKPWECWILERYQKPEFFGDRGDWEKKASFYDDIHQEWVDLRGPFPTRGAYVMVAPLTMDGSYLPMDDAMMRAISEKLAMDERFSSLRETERHDAIIADHKRQEAERNYRTDKNQEHLREYWLKNWDSINRSHTKAYNITPR